MKLSWGFFKLFNLFPALKDINWCLIFGITPSQVLNFFQNLPSLKIGAYRLVLIKQNACTLLMSRKISILAVATSWMNPTILEAKCSSIEILAALKIVTVLKITVLTPVHCWNIIKLMEIPNGTTVFRENNSFPFSSTLVILFLKNIFCQKYSTYMVEQFF